MSFYCFASFICFLLFFFLDSSICQGPECIGCCANHTEINEPRRSIMSVWEHGQIPKCDRDITQGWYRFTSFNGTQMPEKAVTDFHCGTHDPIWLQGSHPSKAEGNVARKACISSFGESCSESFDINIVNCGAYFVYNLKPLHYCASAYCAGFGKPCPYGKVGEHPDCFEPKEEFSSDNLGDPVIKYRPPGKNVSVTLICEVPLLNEIGKQKNVKYKIEWSAEGKTLKTDKICEPAPGKENAGPCPSNEYSVTSKLPGDKYKIGQWISCSVSAVITTNPGNKWSTPKDVREPFFVGLKVSPTVVNLASICDQEIHKITITPTIPVVRGTRGFSNISFHGPPEVDFLEGSCEVALQEGIQPVTITIKAACGGKVTKGLKTIIPYISYQGSKFWRSKTVIDTVKVNIREKTEIHQCSSVGDPHYSTLQANTFRQYYDFMGRGDFILYRNAERHFEVQTRQWTCGSSVTCNCGVVLRDHNDVIEFNCCNDIMERDQTTPIFVKIRSKKCLAPGISINKVVPGVSNAQYEVLFPSGAKVTIQRSYWGMDVKLYTPRAKDSANETGLCLDPEGQDPDSYGNSSRLQKGQSFFDILPPPVEDYKVQYTTACKCIKKDEKCKNAFDVAFPTVLEKEKKNLSPMFLCDHRQKRDVLFSDEPTEEDIQLFKQTRFSRHRSRRELVTEISPEDPTRYCAERISETKIGKLCAKVGVNVQALVSVCSADIQFTGDVSFASGSVAALVDECGSLAARNLSLLRNESSEDSGTSGSVLVEEITESLCPNDCSFNGKCVNGSCVCNKNFTAEDCSASIYLKPTISSLQGEGLCDKQKRPCKKVTVLGTGFVNSKNMTCHVKEFKVVHSSWTPNNTEHRFPGEMTDLVLADCYLPESPVMPGYFNEIDEGTPAAGLVISVSNDGEHRSHETITFISYDSACMSCNVSSGCALKKNSCFINGYCFAPSDTNPVDWCYQCVPDVSTNSWTKRQANLPPQFSPTKEFYALFEEHLELAIDVSDPEGMPVTVSLMGGSPSEAIMRDNVLLWTVTSDAKTQFFLKATDACQAVSTNDITVSLVVCPCQNNGKCVPHPNEPRGSGLYQCDCKPGFTGDKCETNIDECQSYPCLRGRCIDGLNKFTCICDPGYVGRICDTDYDDCSSSPCVHGSCTDFTGAYRCTCDPGYSGQNCNVDIDECQSSPCRHGACVDRVNGYTCQCQQGYTGFDCNVEIDECQSSPCVHGTCLDKVNDFTCNCRAGYTGKRCDEDINDCLSSPCENGACIDLVNDYSCRCKVGFTGRNCDVVIRYCTEDSCYPNVACSKSGETITCGPCPLGFTGDGKSCEDIDDCVNHACQNGGSCIDGVNSYSCNCQEGFTGDRCQTDIDDCVNRICHNGGLCVDGINSYTCNCVTGYTGDHCETDIDDCAYRTCQNGGSCADGVNSYSCNCVAGFIGDHCETDIDDCFNRTCHNGGSCVDGINGYSCNCVTGYTGDHCETDIDDCVNRTCQNGGSCIDGIDSYSCNCVAGFTGDHCETDIDDCVNHTCHNGGSCIDGLNSYSCNCLEGFTGDLCQTDTDDCFNRTCLNGGSCVDGINSYLCNCVTGYTGDHCETDIDDCVNRTCHNGGSCIDGVNSYSCNCVAGFTGDHCETDIDDCVNHACHNGGSCIDGLNSYSCNCLEGFTGDLCDTDIDDCFNRTCLNGGSCVDEINSYSCNCVTGYTGNHCETDIDDCVNRTCQNGGSCIDGIDSYSCNCVAGFTGDHCETDIDDCVNHACHNGGSCIDGVKSYSCKCLEGFTGDRCQTDIDDCVHRTCQNGGSCIDGVNSYSCNCVAGFVGDHCETKACLPPWTVYKKGCYRVAFSMFGSQKWKAALLRCRRMRSHVVTISSEEENDFVAELAKAFVKKMLLGQVHVWLGLRKKHARAPYQWEDGTSLGSYSNWVPGEPNGELCTEMLVSGTYQFGKWNDVRCDTTRYEPITVCEKPLRNGE